MDGNVVKAAWILGGSIVLSTALLGGGALVSTVYFSRQLWQQADVISRRSADALMAAPKNTVVTFDPGNMIKVGFEPKLPVSVHVENSMDENRGTRAVFEVEVKPTLAK